MQANKPYSLVTLTHCSVLKVQRIETKYTVKTVYYIVGVHNGEGPPVPIPNTEVKLTRADNTWLETAREDRYMPT